MDTILLEETTLPYSIKPINVGAGDQFAPESLAMSPNNRIPAIVDDQPEDGGAPLSILNRPQFYSTSLTKRGSSCPGSARPG